VFWQRHFLKENLSVVKISSDVRSWPQDGPISEIIDGSTCQSLCSKIFSTYLVAFKGCLNFFIKDKVSLFISETGNLNDIGLNNVLTYKS
jgi:hypothetical protein